VGEWKGFGSGLGGPRFMELKRRDIIAKGRELEVAVKAGNASKVRQLCGVCVCVYIYIYESLHI
jgi:hypothetical protein